VISRRPGSIGVGSELAFAAASNMTGGLASPLSLIAVTRPSETPAASASVSARSRASVTAAFSA
jgi:hypothetical protein